MRSNVLEKHDVANAANVADGAGRGDCPETPRGRNSIASVSIAPAGIGGGPAGLADLQMLLQDTGQLAGPSWPAQRDRSPAGGRVVKSPRASAQVCPCGQGRLVGERRDSMGSGRVDDSEAQGQASAGGSDGKDSSGGGGSQRVGIGRQFAEPRPIVIPPKLYRIGEIVEHSGLSRQTIHNYTTMGLLIEARRTEGGHRLYDESVFKRLNGIMALKAQHKSLAYIREYYAKLDAG